MSVCSQRVAGLTAGSGSALCSHSDWTRARLSQGKPRLGQGTAGAGLAVAGCGNGDTGAGHSWGRRWELKARLNQGSTDGSAELRLYARGWCGDRELQWRRRTGVGRSCTRAPQGDQRRRWETGHEQRRLCGTR